ncbi:hypothetical protein KC19_1G054400 [Ceratodon purpureus]|uniref:Uncharacterized protein n=1 Tax=Ceratodon purpureus TaxID=3225 RepID=A0A8T0J1R6_CERPU|nr:hypothetical protein KC19_1G054400 [Ceratodon purpureus]
MHVDRHHVHVLARDTVTRTDLYYSISDSPCSGSGSSPKMQMVCDSGTKWVIVPSSHDQLWWFNGISTMDQWMCGWIFEIVWAFDHE